MNYLFMATKNGTVKRAAISEFDQIRRTGIIAIKLKEGDELCWVESTSGKDEVILVTAGGKSIRFKESDARAMGRAAAGVRGIRVGKGDEVVGMEVIAVRQRGSKAARQQDKKNKKTVKLPSRRTAKLLIVTENGYGKLTKLSEYPLQKRGGRGVLTAKVTKRTGPVVASRIITDTKGDLLLTSAEGQVIRLPLKDISTLGRATQGVRLMRLSTGDSVAALACLEQ